MPRPQFTLRALLVVVAVTGLVIVVTKGASHLLILVSPYEFGLKTPHWTVLVIASFLVGIKCGHYHAKRNEISPA